jgi:hypothetical protein
VSFEIIFANAAILQRTAFVVLDLQQSVAVILTDGVQPARIDPLHFYRGTLEPFRSLRL